ncbi:MAG: hypothetical protein V7603_5092 [Micromonosporaceae bacterium]
MTDEEAEETVRAEPNTPGLDETPESDRAASSDDRADLWDTVTLTQAGGQGGGGDILEYAAGGFLALKVLGPMAEAFAQKLGEHLGESAIAAARRIRRRRARYDDQSTPLWDCLTIDGAKGARTVIMIDDFPDEARLALIDLDVTADGIRGWTLQWDPDAGAWRHSRLDFDPDTHISTTHEEGKGR